jgi:hypothetical protein
MLQTKLNTIRQNNFFCLIVSKKKLNFVYEISRQAEDNRREDNEMQPASHHVVTFEGDVMSLNGKILSGHYLSSSAVTDDTDQVSVCSCTCLGRRSINSCLPTVCRPLLDEPNSCSPPYPPPLTPQKLNRVKRASV